MNNFYVSLDPQCQYTAWYKAIVDVEYFLNSIGFEPIPIQSCLVNMEQCLNDLLTTNDDQNKEGMILIQYPRVLFEGLNLSALIDYIKTNFSNYKLVAVIHDLDSIRFGDFLTTNYLPEVYTLNKFNYLIAVNDAMSRLLREHGIKPKTYALKIFDYVLEKENNITRVKNQSNKTIAFAGNLKYEKSQFVYKLPELDLNNIIINLYGPFLNQEKFNSSENICYKGAFMPEDLPNHMNDGFGLCWDGNSLDCCDGKNGKYFKYSNPHKASLYLAIGIPIIVSKDIALSSFVKKEHVGLVINSLYDISDVLNNITNEKYELLQKNVNKISQKLRNGYYLKSVINEIEQDILY